ncbi:hypothetical protein F511_19102 [Dorcoceras hygrometricum]|uniref:Uncharacterized protein n=1 Tax=Dorcoceras hygrometricum TaxID=472368 RepID=A0A2Z7ARD4_9LAMI|nr:hypothetical protein F511_19102 [Dorcoceras hygrometricum]
MSDSIFCLTSAYLFRSFPLTSASFFIRFLLSSDLFSTSDLSSALSSDLFSTSDLSSALSLDLFSTSDLYSDSTGSEWLRCDVVGCLAVGFRSQLRWFSVRIFPDSESCRDTLATVHRTLSSPIAYGRAPTEDARASGDTALSSPCWDLLATMCRVVNYHSSWARQRQVELFDAFGIWVLCQGNQGFTVGRGFNLAGGAPGGG